jgi:predicted esterase
MFRGPGLSLFVTTALASVLLAQDAGTVLGLSVTERTLRNTVKLDAARMEQVDRLTAAAVKANAAKDYPEAFRDLKHAISLLNRVEWTPALAWSAAVSLKSGHCILDPGQFVNLTLTQSYPLDQPLDQRPYATVYLTPFYSGQPRTVLKTFDRLDPDFSKSPLEIRVRIPNTPDGPYRLVVEFTGLASKNVPVRVLRGVMAGVAQTEARIAKLDPAKAPELPSAEGHLVRIEAADRGEFGDRLANVDCAFELSQAKRLLADIVIGKDPFTKQYGDLQKAYRSSVDNSIQPYRLFIPSSYDGRKAFPLIVLLHGMGGDENTMFDSYGNGAFETLAEKHGYIVVCPKGRQPTSMYRGAAEQDVLDVLADVRRAYKIDPNRIYLTGHSMGAYGTWSIASDHPDLFAAIAPISGGGDPAEVLKTAKIPQLVTHGDKDPTVPVDNSRVMVEALKKAGAEVKYDEIPGGNHVSVAVPAFAPIFDWFDTHQKETK